MKGSLLMTKYFATLLLVSSSLPMAASRCAERGTAYMGKKTVEVEACSWHREEKCELRGPDVDGKPTWVEGKKSITLYYQQCDPTKSTADFTKYMNDLNAYKSLVTVQGEEYKIYPMTKQFTMTMKWKWHDTSGSWTADTFAGKTLFQPGSRSEFTLSKYIQQGLSDAFCMLSQQMASDSCPYDDGEPAVNNDGSSGNSDCSYSSSPLCAWDIHVVTQSDDPVGKSQESGNGGLHTYMPTGDSIVRSKRNYADQSAIDIWDVRYHGYTRPAMQMADVEFVGEEVEGLQPVKVTFVVFLKNAYQALAMDHLFEFIGTDTMDTFLENYVKLYINSHLKYFIDPKQNPSGGTMGSKAPPPRCSRCHPEIRSVDEITALKPRRGSDCPQDRKFGGAYITYDQFMYTGTKHRVSPKPDVMEARYTSTVGKPMEMCQDHRQMEFHKLDGFAKLSGHSESSFPMYVRYGMRIGITTGYVATTAAPIATTTGPQTTAVPVTTVIQGTISTTATLRSDATKEDFHNNVKDGYTNGIADMLIVPPDFVSVTVPKDLTSAGLSFDVSYTITVPSNAVDASGGELTPDRIVWRIEKNGYADWSRKLSLRVNAQGKILVTVTSVDKPTVTPGGRRLASANPDFKFFGSDGFYRSAAVNNAFVNAILFVMRETEKYGSDGDGKFMNGELGAMTAANVKVFFGVSPSTPIKEETEKHTQNMDVTYIVRVTNRQERDAFFGFANWGAAVYLLNRRLVKEFADISTLPAGYMPYPKINYDPKYLNGELFGAHGSLAGVFGTPSKVTYPCDSEVVAAAGFVKPCASTGGSDGGSGGNGTSSKDVSGTTRMTGTVMAVMGVITMF